jgi:hypothetical protein
MPFPTSHGTFDAPCDHRRAERRVADGELATFPEMRGVQPTISRFLLSRNLFEPGPAAPPFRSRGGAVKHEMREGR